MKKVEIFTDGACSGNPGPGGWAALLRFGDVEKMLSGGAAHTTNNRMELQGAIEGLLALKVPCQVTLYTDSQYVQKGMREWMPGWQKKAFKGVKNPELWQALLAAAQPHVIDWQWVRGHNGHAENERVDEAARMAAIPFGYPGS
ncbi:MAG: ribonuclease HI [Proteobacteria bacterium]|nr:ribonuclease HI [Pseudomonadota bacterium]